MLHKGGEGNLKRVKTVFKKETNVGKKPSWRRGEMQ